VLRSLLWLRNGEILRSTETAARIGRGFGYLLMFLGFLEVVDRAPVSGLPIVPSGLPRSCARSEGRHHGAMQLCARLAWTARSRAGRAPLVAALALMGPTSLPEGAVHSWATCFVGCRHVEAWCKERGIAPLSKTLIAERVLRRADKTGLMVEPARKAAVRKLYRDLRRVLGLGPHS
jgi:hypothetical protein